MGAAATETRPSGAELKRMKKEREDAEQAKIAGAHAALGTDGIDTGPQDVHDGDPDETGDTPGTQLSFAVGGKRPTESVLKVDVGKIELTGTFKKGSMVTVELAVLVTEVNFKDQLDAVTKQAIGCQRAQVGDVTDYRVAVQ